MSKSEIPKYNDILWPTLKALRSIGGSGSIAELVEETAKVMNLDEAILEISHGNTNLSEFEYRCAWARTNLKAIGLVDNSERGVWTLTTAGRAATSETEVRQAVSEHYKRYRSKKKAESKLEQIESSNSVVVEEFQSLGEEWKEKLLVVLKNMDAEAFERLCQRVLRESNFEEVEVTGKSGDGGIDGVGILKMNLLSFRVVFQAKRYKETVQPSVVRDFRGGMVGRADKGLIITTARFTSGARREAVRDGAPAIDLVDGERFCALLKSLGLGVSTKMVEKVEIDEQFFANF